MFTKAEQKFSWLYLGARRTIFMFILFWIVTGSGGCFEHYYQTNTVHKVDADTVKKLIRANKYFILHASDEIFALRNVKVSSEFLDGNLDSLSANHESYLDPQKPEKNSYSKQNAGDVFREVHIYLEKRDSSQASIHVPLADISRMDIYGPDVKHTKRATVASIVGVTLVTAGVIGLIVAAGQANHSQPAPPANGGGGEGGGISCSPLIYLTDSGNSSFQGTLFSGAIFNSLSRKDWLPLNLSQPAEKLTLSVEGEKNEQLFLHDLALLQVVHRRGEKVLFDRHGTILSFKNPISPFHATIGEPAPGLLREISSPDSHSYSFTNEGQDQHSSDIVFDFKKPKNTRKGKLIIRAKNSFWANNIFGQYKALYGEFYQSMIKRKDSSNHEKVEQCELDQFLPILVSIKERTGWKYQDYFPTPGSHIFRDMIMELDLDQLAKADHVEIMLQTCFYFWDLDYAAMDFSEEDQFTADTILPARLTISGQNPAVLKSSSDYTHQQISAGQTLNLEFNMNRTGDPNSECSYFLTGRGYYHDNVKYQGQPNLTEITRFSGKGAFDRYSREKLMEYAEDLKSKYVQVQMKDK
jgi:hypothetical protein